MPDVQEEPKRSDLAPLEERDLGRVMGVRDAVLLAVLVCGGLAVALSIATRCVNGVALLGFVGALLAGRMLFAGGRR